MQLKKLKKPIRYAFSRLLMVGVILTLGFLSLTSVVAWCGLIGIGIMAFILAGVIEGEVYAQGINEAWKKFFNRNHFRDVICLRTLEELLTDKENRKNNQFLQEYHALKKAIHHLEEQIKKDELTKAAFEADLKGQELAHKIDEKQKLAKLAERETRNAANAKNLKNLKNDLKLMQKYFQEFVSGNIKNTNALEKLNIDKATILAEIQRKIWISRGILVMSIIAGIGMGLVFLNVAPAGIVSLASLFGVTLVAAALPQALVIVLFVFAVITAAGYMSLMYKALTGVLEKNLSAWFQNFRAYFQLRKDETNLQFSLRIGFSILVGLIIIALGAFATVTTALTWWYAAQAGVTLIAPATAAITWAINIIIGITAAATLIFTFAYSLETVQKLSKLSSQFFEKKWEEFTHKIKAAWKNFNLIQVLIILITEVFKFLAFMGHIIFTGLVGEGSNLLPENLKGLTTALNALSDLTVDATAHMEIEEDYHSHSHAHGGHSHEHFDIPEWLCKRLLLPLYALSTLWDFCATPNTNSASSANGWILLETWGNMLKKSWIKAFFGIDAPTLSEKNEKVHDIPVLDESYRRTLSVLKITKTLDTKSNELTHEEQTKFSELKQKLNNSEPVTIQDFFRAPSSSGLEAHTIRSDRADKLYSKLEKINPASLAPNMGSS